MKGPFAHSIEKFLEPVGHLLRDPGVSEIMINGPSEVWVERKGLISKTDASFPSRRSLDATLTNISQYAGRQLDLLHPILEAHLPDGSRLEAVLPPIAKDGPAVSIRRFSRSTITVEKLVKLGSLSRQAGDLPGQIRGKAPEHRCLGRHGLGQDLPAGCIVRVLFRQRTNGCHRGYK